LLSGSGAMARSDEQARMMAPQRLRSRKAPPERGPKVCAIEALGLGVVALIMVTAPLRYAMQRLGGVRQRVLG
jgi:hypothetical protein